MNKILVSALCTLVLLAGSVFAAPNTPTGLTLSATSHTITAAWNANSDEIDGYYLSYNISGESIVTRIDIPLGEGTSYTISGLKNSTTYKIALKAYAGDEESNESSKTITTQNIVVVAELVDVGTIEIYLDEYSSGIDSYEIEMGTTSGVYDYPLTDADELAPDAVYAVTGLTSGTTYFIRVTVDYGSAGTSQADEISVTVEDFGTFLSSTSGIDNGCFVTSARPTGVFRTALLLLGLLLFAAAGFRFPSFRSVFLAILLIAGLSSAARADEGEYKNLVGIKGGVFLPSEDVQRDVYDSIVPWGLFYERMFGTYISADIFAGYCRSKGYALTASGEETGVQTTLDLIPVSASINLNVPVHPLITLYLGAGGDYWTFREKYVGQESDHDVGGWHGKAGVKMFTADAEFYGRAGILLEANYAQIDKFGQNDVDLGGWTFNLGIMYSF